MQAVGERVERRFQVAIEDEDAPLVRAAVAGDLGAFERLAERYAGRVTSVARRFLADPNDVEDAVQETFLRAFEHLRRFCPGTSLRAWLVRIAINVCKNKRSGFWRRRVALAGDGTLLGDLPVDAQAAAENALLRRELEGAICRLPERLRLPFILHFLEGLSGAEIAAALQWNESTVWSRIYAARRTLRQQLSELF
jgi:RNA polymerase sigma-70 factor (ECF subfamily)